MDHLDSMRVFARVAELGSFSGAARQLSMSPPTVSRHVGALEERLNVRLLERSTRHVSLTDAGEEYLPRCIEILEQVDALDQDTSSHGDQPRGLLRISVPLDFGLLFLSEAIRGYLSQCPEARIEVAYEDRRVHLLDENLDLLIRIGRLRDSSLVARRIGQACLGCYAAPDYLTRFGQPTAPSELGEHELLQYTLAREPASWTFESGGQAVHVPVRSRYRANNGRALVVAARQGLGIVRVPEFLVQEALREGTLIEILEDHRSPPLDISVVYARRTFNPAKITAFTEFLLEYFDRRRLW